MKYEVKLPKLVTSVGKEQFLTYDPDKNIFFAFNKTNHCEQTFEYEEIPEEYRQWATRLSNRWRPETGDKYWFISEDSEYPMNLYWEGDLIDEHIFSIGNCFKTEAEAEFEIERLKVIAELKDFSKPFEKNKGDFYITCDYFFDELNIFRCTNIDFQGAIYFDSEETAKKAIDAVGEDRLKKYLFGVE